MKEDRESNIDDLVDITCDETIQVERSPVHEVVTTMNEFRELAKSPVHEVVTTMNEFRELTKSPVQEVVTTMNEFRELTKSPVQEVVTTMNEFRELAKSPVQELSNQLRETFSSIQSVTQQLAGIFDLIPQIDLSKLVNDIDIKEFEAVNYYENGFRRIGIAVDLKFLFYLKNVTEGEKYLSKYITESDEKLKSFLIDYLRERMDENNLEFEFDSKHKDFQLFKESMLQSIREKNWIASSMMLHTYIDKLTKELFKEFNENERRQLELYAKEKPKSQYDKRNRQALMSALTDLDEYQMTASIAEAKSLLPLVYLQIACSIYDTFPSKVSRNSVIHYNDVVDFTLIDEFYVYKLIQIAKLFEQQLPISKEYIMRTLEVLHK